MVTDDESLARQLRTLKFHGLGVDAYDRQTWGRAPQAEVLTPGYKYNLTDINAAIALTQLHKLEQLNARRHDIAAQYQNALVNLPFQPLALPAWPHIHSWHLFIIRVDEQRCGINRDTLMEALKEKVLAPDFIFAPLTRKSIIANIFLICRYPIRNGIANASARCHFSRI